MHERESRIRVDGNTNLDDPLWSDEENITIMETVLDSVYLYLPLEETWQWRKTWSSTCKLKGCRTQMIVRLLRTSDLAQASHASFILYLAMSGDVEMKVWGWPTHICSWPILSQSEEQKPEDEWVRLTSTDGFSVIVKRKVATGSGTLKSMLSAESKSSSLSCNVVLTWLRDSA